MNHTRFFHLWLFFALLLAGGLPEAFLKNAISAARERSTPRIILSSASSGYRGRMVWRMILLKYSTRLPVPSILAGG